MDKLERLPRHVSLIMDGNGRWAKMRGKDRIYGHYEGVASVRAVMEASVEWGVEYVSFFAFSEENWDRPSDEVQGLMELMGTMMERELPTFMEHDIRFLVLGNRERLSDKLRESIDGIMEKTSGNRGMTMILFLSYSGKWDIYQAARRMAHEKRISNYLLWQSAYTEFVFTDTLWPDFRREQYRSALEEYASRDRRFGKVK